MEPADPARLPLALARFLALWESKRGDRRMPRRGDFSHEDLMPWMGVLNLMAVEGDDARFVIFAGESARRYGKEMTGKRLSQFEPRSLADAALADHRAFMAAGGIAMSKVVTGPFDNRELRWTRLAAPLSEDGTAIDRYFVALEFER